MLNCLTTYSIENICVSKHLIVNYLYSLTHVLKFLKIAMYTYHAYHIQYLYPYSGQRYYGAICNFHFNISNTWGVSGENWWQLIIWSNALESIIHTTVLRVVLKAWRNDSLSASNAIGADLEKSCTTLHRSIHSTTPRCGTCCDRAKKRGHCRNKVSRPKQRWHTPPREQTSSSTCGPHPPAMTMSSEEFADRSLLNTPN